MSRTIRKPRWAFALSVLMPLCLPALAKRVPPKPVTPVVSGDLKYSAAGDGRDQYVVAQDLKSGSQLWKVKVFHISIKPWLEQDVQWVFITDLKLVEQALLIRDEEAHCHSLDLSTKHVKKVSCGSEF